MVKKLETWYFQLLVSSAQLSDLVDSVYLLSDRSSPILLAAQVQQGQQVQLSLALFELTGFTEPNIGDPG